MALTYRDIRCAFHEYILRILCNGWMDCRDAFHAALCLYCSVTDKTYLNMKRTGLWAFQKLIFGAGVSRAYSLYFLLWLDGLQRYFSCLCNKCNKAEYEANWLISVPIINY